LDILKLTSDLRRDRIRLVERLREEGIKDLAVLHAFDLVPRHLFVPDAMRHQAYKNIPIPIGDGQTISSPEIHAISLELAEIHQGDRVLEVGTGSGFQTALLAALGADVYSIERLSPLSNRARDTLLKLGYQVHLEIGDGSLGLPEHAPYSAIIVGAAAKEPPTALFEQLTEGGRLIIPIGTIDQTLYRYIQRGTEYIQERIGGARFVPLIEESTH
jgi:protein-L-isoaspartate(D-aspartate) O-methyltransferase